MGMTPVESVYGASTKGLARTVNHAGKSVDMKRDVPEPWASAMLKAGVVDKRYGNPSWSELARRVSVHPSTITAMADGTRVTDVATIAKVADELRVTSDVVGTWIGETRQIGDLYEPPAESRFLSGEEKKALTLLIKSIADSKAGTGHVAQPDQKMTEESTVVPIQRAARKKTQRRGMPEKNAGE